MTRAEEFRQLHDEGKSLAEIGELNGISKQRVAQIMGKVDRDAAEELRRSRLESAQRVIAGESTVAEEVEIFGITEATYREYVREKLGLTLPRRNAAVPHGTVYQYNRGCHCEECRAAMRERYRLRKEARA